jgi:hypothetical protein
VLGKGAGRQSTTGRVQLPTALARNCCNAK